MSLQQLDPKEIIKQHLNKFSLEKKAIPENTTPEALHQTRVAARRLISVLWAFKKFIPKKGQKKLTRRLTKLVESLSHARDFDCLIIYLKDFANKLEHLDHKNGLVRLTDLLQEKRHSLQPDVLAIIAKDKLSKKLTKLTKKVSPLSNKKAQKLATLGAKKIQKIISKLLEFDSCLEQAGNKDQLHQLRLVVKNLRYTLENFQPIFGAKIDYFQRQAHDLQNLLGSIHDHDSWAKIIPSLISKNGYDLEIKAAAQYFEQQGQEARRHSYNNFLDFWAKAKQQNLWQQLLEQLIQSKTANKPEKAEKPETEQPGKDSNDFKLIVQLIELAKSCNYESEHSNQVAKVALQLFDQLEPLHKLGEEERLWLRSAALLHDIGLNQDPEEHHKVSRDQILKLQINFLNKREKTMVALSARYHRKAIPKKSHKHFKDLNKTEQKTVNTLAAILRIADGLDRSHSSIVKEVTSKLEPARVILTVLADQFSAVDQATGQEKADLFTNIFDKELVINWPTPTVVLRSKTATKIIHSQPLFN